MGSETILILTAAVALLATVGIILAVLRIMYSPIATVAMIGLLGWCLAVYQMSN